MDETYGLNRSRTAYQACMRRELKGRTGGGVRGATSRLKRASHKCAGGRRHAARRRRRAG